MDGNKIVPIGFPFGALPSLSLDDDQHTFAVSGLPKSSDLYCRYSVCIVLGMRSTGTKEIRAPL
jgi:hypothetical protein